MRLRAPDPVCERGCGAHIATCPDCQRELEGLRPVVDRFVAWATDVLRPPASVQGRLAHRIAEETGKQPVLPPEPRWSEPEWEQVAPGTECKLLATDTERHRVSMADAAPEDTYMRNDLENETAAATLPRKARLEALTTYADTLGAGASYDVALSVALAKLRAYCPTSTERQLRAWLAKALAAD